MSGSVMSRRALLGTLSALGLMPQLVRAEGEAATAAAEGATVIEPKTFGVKLGDPLPFSRATLEAEAKALAAADYVPPPEVSSEWRDLTYDQFREIWFDTRNGLFRDSDSAVRADLFIAGLYQTHEVEVNAVKDGMARRVAFDLGLYDTTDRFPQLDPAGTGFSGIRLLGELVEPTVFQEYAVFQGATYFRAIGKEQIYGLSARGLAIGTTGANGPEEFPLFRAYWVEAAAAGSAEAVVHALMDGPSATGAYTFRIRKGLPTVIEVEATVYPRVELTDFGIAPETSMFLFNDLNRIKFDDFREGVHDSDGLQIANGAGEILWRPLRNPERVEMSGFGDTGLRGFGLMQRARDPESYLDFEAKYERRPSLWVEPLGDWGKGRVMLMEIPADKEIYDNIVAYWQPDAPMAAGSEQKFSYRLYWGEDAPVDGLVARVQGSRTGERVFEEGRIFTIDYAPHPALGEDISALEARVSTSSGEVKGVQVKPNPATGGVRVAATFLMPEGIPAELRVELWRDAVRVGEVWLYRWFGA
ncbi:glucan biosynthesis protein [Pseudogemmobacter blasticus]|nr:glucan biosynthesis protein [Fuscovulum blasticum]